jgi:glycosyltransferase involved in cell wall biosynthesis
MYCELPSLTTRVGAAEEMITNNENGWIVSVNDDEDLFQTIQSIIKMEKKKQIAIGKKAKATITENYSLQNHIDLLMAMYKKNDK